MDITCIRKFVVFLLAFIRMVEIFRGNFRTVGVIFFCLYVVLLNSRGVFSLLFQYCGK